MTSQSPAERAAPSAAPAASWIPTTGGHSLCLQVAEPQTVAAHRGGILLVHGLFSDARFFLGSNGGPAQFFLDRGYRVFLGELRGHGKSRGPSSSAWDFGFDAYARDDVPALVRAARDKHEGPLFLLCHSMSGYAALAGLALDSSLQASLAGLVMLSSAVNDYSDGGLKKRATLGLGALVGAALGRFPGKALKQGPSDEPGRLMRQFADWAKDGSFKSEDGSVDYWKALANVTLPVFAGIGAADVFHASPRRGEKLVNALGSSRSELVVFGMKNGFSKDFGHVDLVRGQSASQEVLPRVDSFLQSLRADG
jgi:predicted alpha/beta hydrolase